MTAQAKYITGIIETFSTFLESLNISPKLSEATTAKFIKFLKQKKNYNSWSINEIENFIETENLANDVAILIKKFVKNFTPRQVDIFLHQFLTDLKNENRSVSTIKNYKSDIAQFISLVEVDKIANLFTQVNVKQFIKTQFAKNLKLATIKRKLISLTQFAVWAENQKLITDVSFWMSDVDSLFATRPRKLHDSNNQKTASKEAEFGKPVSLPVGEPDKLSIILAKNNKLSGNNTNTAQISNHKKPKLVDDQLDSFLTGLKINNHSKSTIKNYRSDISQFIAFTTPQERQSLKTFITRQNLTKFIHYQVSKGLKPASIKRKLASIAQFAHWAEKKNELKNIALWINNLAYTPQKTSKIKSSHITNTTSNNFELKLKEKTQNQTNIDFDKKHEMSVNTDNDGISSQISNTPTKKTAKRWSLPIPKFIKDTNKATDQEKHSYKSRVRESLKEFANSINTKRNKTFLPYFNLAMIALFFAGVGYFGYQQFIKQTPGSLAYPTTPTRPNRELSFQGRLTDTAQNPITTATNMEFRLYDTGPGTGGTLLWDSSTCSVTPDQDGIFNVGLGDDCGSEISQDVFSENSNVWLEVDVATETLTPRQSIKTVAYALNSETVQGYPISATGAATTNTILTMGSSGEVLLGEVSPTLKATTGTFAIEAQALTLQTSSGSNGDIILDPDELGEVTSTGYFSAPGATFSATYAEGTSLVLKGGPSGTGNIQEWQDSSGTVLDVVDENGNVGVGTTNPSYKLDITDSSTNTAVKVTSGAVFPMQIYDSNSTWAGIGLHATSASAKPFVELFASNDTKAVYHYLDGDNNAWNFYYGGDRLTINSSGNVGIGTTSPGYKLDVDGELNLTDAIRVAGDAGTSGYLLTSSAGGANTWTDPSTLGGGTSYWDNTLNVFHPKDSYADVVDLAIGGTSTASANIHLQSNGQAYFGGNVGIGTTSPAEKFHLIEGTLLVDNPGNPSLEGNYNTSGYAYGVYVSGKYAYVTDTGDGLDIIDVSDPSAPTLVGNYNTSGNATGVYVAGKYAYVADQASGLQIIDVSDPSAPTLEGTYNTTGTAYSVYVSGKYAYVADDTSGLQIIDISDPSSPTLEGTFNTSGHAVAAFISGQYAYVGDSADGLDIVDISDPSSPTLEGNYDTSGDAYAAYVSGKYAYVADNADGLDIIDVSDPSAPTLVGNYNTTGNAIMPYVSGKYVYLTDVASGLQIIDVSDPSSPTLEGTYDTSGNAYNVYVSGKYAYVTDYADGLDIVDIEGADIHAAHIGNIQSDYIGIANNVDIGNNLAVRNGVNVGPGGLYVDAGEVAFDGNSGSTAFKFGQSGTGDILNVFDDTTEVFTILDGGNVGIGTSSPNQKLHISEGNIQIDNTTNANQNGIIYKDSFPFIHNFNYGNNGTATTVGDNTFVGEQSGNFTMGSTATSNGQASYNTAMGAFSLHDNTIGDNNTAQGAYSLINNTEGSNNTAVGAFSLYENTSGDHNTAQGMYALHYNTTGYQNTAIGNEAGYGVSGSGNIFGNTLLGYRAGYGLITGGSYNTLLGHQAGDNVTTGVRNIIIGYNTDAASATGDDQLNIGNTIYGDLNSGNVGIGTTSPGVKLDIVDTSTASNTLQITNSASGVSARAGIKIVGDGGYGAISYRSASATYVPDSFQIASSGGPIVLNPGNGATGLMYLTESGNVGIGTTDPIEKLDIGLSTIRAGKFIDASDSDYYLDPAATTSLTTAGNVGIGTTSPSIDVNYGVGTVLQIGESGDYPTLVLSGYNVHQEMNRYASNNHNEIVFLTNSVDKWRIGQSDSDNAGDGSEFFIGTAAGGTNPALWIEESGNVGIGTTSPGAKLDVLGTDNDTVIKVVRGNDTSQYLSLKGYQIYGSGNHMLLSADDSYSLWLGHQSDTSEMVIDTSGNVGIGTTSPTTTLSVVNNNESTTLADITQSLTNAGIQIETQYTDSAYTPGLFWSTSDNNETKPKGGIWLFENGYGTNMYFGTSNGYSTGITNNGLVLDKDGNVGIGTTSPAVKLDVAGGLNLTDRTYTLNNYVRTFENVADYYAGSTPTTGTIVITIGSTPNIMLEAEIVVQGYNGLTKCQVRGYTYTGSTTWHMPAGTCLSSGHSGGYTVRFGKRSSDNARVILLGTTSSNWGNYPHVTVTRVTYGYPGSGSSIGNWSISMVTDESAYSNIASVNENSGFSAYNSTFSGNTNFPSGIWNSSGNVGIGTTSPTTKLHIRDDGADGVINYALTLQNSTHTITDNTTGQAIKFRLGNNTETNKWASIGIIKESSWENESGLFFATDEGNERMRIDNSGNVGIGTTSPGAALHIYDAGNEMIRLAGTSTTSSPYLSFYQTTTRRAYIQLADSANDLRLNSEYGDISFYTNGGERMEIDSTGNVGIGTTSPGAKLEVISSVSKILNLDGGGNGDYDSGLYLNNKAAVTADTYDGVWLRLNQNNDFANGIYTPGKLRVDNTTDMRNVMTFNTAGRIVTADSGAAGLNSYLQIGDDAYFSDEDIADTIGVRRMSDGSWGKMKTYITNPSSRDYKTNITIIDEPEIENLLSILKNLEIARFSLKSEVATAATNSAQVPERHLGIIAEDAPDIVSDRGPKKGINSYDYSSMALFGAQYSVNKLSKLGNLFLTDTGNVQIIGTSTNTTDPLNISTNTYTITNAGELIENIGIFAKLATAKIVTGLTQTTDLIVDQVATIQTASITNLSVDSINIAGQSLPSYITDIIMNLSLDDSNQNSSNSATLNNMAINNLISPIPEGTAIDIATESGSVLFRNNLDNTIAELDNAGNLSLLGSLLTNDNATISGQLTVTGDASISGTLLSKIIDTDVINASTISANSIDTNNLITATISADTIDVASARITALEAGMAELEQVKATTAEIVTATVSGTLYADNIYNFEQTISDTLQTPGLLDLITGQNESTASATYMEELYDIVNASEYNATTSADLNLSLSDLSLTNDDITLTGSALFIEKYFKVNGAGYIADSLGIGNDLFVNNSIITGSIAIGTDGFITQIANGTIQYTSPTPENQIFKIQPDGQGSIELLAGLVALDDSGLVSINGNLETTGDIKAGGTLLTDLIKPTDFGNPLQVQVAGIATESGEVVESRFEIINEVGAPVATFSAQGAAKFAGKVEASGGIGVDSQSLGSSDNNELSTDKTSGKATIKLGANEVKIKSNLITDQSLVYITAVGSTGNQVLYVKSQVPEDTETPEDEGEFVVGFDNPTTTDVSFNWWVVN